MVICVKVLDWGYFSLFGVEVDVLRILFGVVLILIVWDLVFFVKYEIFIV